MPPTLIRFIWRGNKRGQLVLFLLTMLALPFYYASLELPKLIVNDVLGDGQVTFPIEISTFGRELMELDRVHWLVVLCVAFLLAVVVQGGVKFFLNVYKGRIGGELLLKLRRELCVRVLHLPLEALGGVSSDELGTMIGSELSDVGAFAGEAFATPLLQGGLLITAIAFIFIQDPWLGLAAVALFPVQGYVIPKLQKRVNSLTRERVYAMRSFASRLGEATDALPEIQASAGSAVELDALQKLLVRIYEIRYAIFWRRSFIKLLNSFLFQLTPFLFLLVGGYLVLRGDLTLGALVAVLAAYKDLPPSARELLDFYQSYQNVRVQYEQIVGQFGPQGFELNAGGPSVTASTRRTGSAIDVESMTIGRMGEPPLLTDVSFISAQGESVAVVGIDERARAAFARALVGLERPFQGSICIGGIDAAELMPDDRRGITLVGRHSAVFNGSFRYNLHYGHPHQDAPAERDFEALRLVQMLDELPFLGLNTILDVSTHGEIAEKIRRARPQVRARLHEEGLIEPFESNTICRHASIAKNIVFGLPLGSNINLDDLAEHPAARRAIRRARLEKPLLALAVELSRRQVENESSDLNQGTRENALTFSDERGPLHAALMRAQPLDLEHLDGAEHRLMLNIAMRAIPARHSWLRIDEDLSNRVLAARQFFRHGLSRSDRAQIEFFDPERYNRGLTIRENLLFGVVKATRTESVVRLETTLLELMDEVGLTDSITQGGFEYLIGLRGSRLTASQRQKLALARLLIREPELAVLHDATRTLDEQTESAVVSNVATARRGHGLIWILGRPSLARYFDTVLVFERGQLVGRGAYSDLDREGAPLHTLLTRRPVA